LSVAVYKSIMAVRCCILKSVAILMTFGQHFKSWDRETGYQLGYHYLYCLCVCVCEYVAFVIIT